MRSRQSLIRNHPLFASALYIHDTLAKGGYTTVLAGGCVRDSLLGLSPQDLDLATSAPAEVVEKSFARTLAVGKAFGTIVVVEGGHNFEVTTFRAEGPYRDGRHPESITSTDMRGDAERRDFTVNALFYDPVSDEVFDFVGGVADLDAKLLRTVGDAGARFGEDHLRMLRAPRFVAQLGFGLDRAALRAMQALAPQLARVAAERVFNEMRRLLGASYVQRGFEVLLESKLSAVIWPEAIGAASAKLADFPAFVNWENAFAAIMLLAGQGAACETRLRAWKAPRESLRRVQMQIEGCHILLNPSVRKAERMRVLGAETFAESLVLAQGLAPDQARPQEWIAEFLKVADRTGKPPPPLLNGQDLLTIGMAPGATMGKILKDVYDQQLEGMISTKEQALEAAKKA